MAPLSPVIGETISHYRVAENLGGGGSERRTQDHHDPVETARARNCSVGRDPVLPGIPLQEDDRYSSLIEDAGGGR